MADFFTVTVSQVNRRLSLLVSGEKALNDLYITGEISNFTLHRPSGHVYFTLKDEQASIKCVMFKSYASQTAFLPQNGMSVIVHGRVSVYERDGANQIYVTELFEEGQGQLYMQFLRVREKLEKNGYFAQKRELPQIIKNVCIITSEKAAALKDMLNVIGERCPLVKVTLIPASVQGDTAPETLIAALRRAQDTDADVIIIGRGGGSAEDLSAFNDEVLAVELFNSRIPTISAVGHETDFSISDFVADKRAPTPTAAAVMVTPFTLEDIYGIADGLLTSIRTAFERLTETYAARLSAYKKSISALSPENKLVFYEKELSLKAGFLQKAALKVIDKCEAELDKKAALISAVNPMNVLVRGYAIVRQDGRAVTSPDNVEIGSQLDITVCGGEISATVTAKQPTDGKDGI